MALIGIITAIQAMNQKLTESFSTMGANGFTIRYKQRNIRFGQGGGNNNSEMKISQKGQRKERTSNLDKKITIKQAELFVDSFQFPATIGIGISGGRNSIISY